MNNQPEFTVSEVMPEGSILVLPNPLITAVNLT